MRKVWTTFQLAVDYLSRDNWGIFIWTCFLLDVLLHFGVGVVSVIAIASQDNISEQLQAALAFFFILELDEWMYLVFIQPFDVLDEEDFTLVFDLRGGAPSIIRNSRVGDDGHGSRHTVPTRSPGHENGEEERKEEEKGGGGEAEALVLISGDGTHHEEIDRLIREKLEKRARNGVRWGLFLVALQVYSVIYANV